MITPLFILFIVLNVYVILSAPLLPRSRSIIDFWRRKRGHSKAHDETFSDPGYSVEVDCRSCGQFNRVPSHRLRDRPTCGRCKERLMPGRRVVVCRMFQMEGVMRAELDALWRDEDRLWQCLADHVAIEAKARAEAIDPQRKVVN